MTGFDFVVLAILAVSAVLGLVRGLLKELLSLVAYVLAFVAAIWWGPTVYGWLEPYIETTVLRMGVSYAAVFIIVLLGVGLVNMTLGALIRTTGLSPADHGLGGMFGLARGLLIVLVLVGLAGYTPLPQEPWWQDAMFSHSATQAVLKVKSMLPESLGTWVPY
ncbi:colicin V synthesis protein [Bordetella genomosp. 5]|uniref:Colicin V synthesis protein n=1 Tax=Bordetella genomosp. 5 TaxID=1395608 RepID=A0A261TUS7_9BORD|nr:CvpA family protein [Bordetella genomosp. 5]OZI43526.1 colicin V synthesis protein [Bordetella genomosp. 5]OZI52770.1 colicin V synthesis protein [Bordetella genomosp. 5]